MAVTRCSGARRASVVARAVDRTVAASRPVAPEGWAAAEGRPFTVPEGALGTTLACALPLVLRAGTGALVAGWKPSVVKDDGAEGYKLGAAGFRLKEECSLGPRPEQTLVLYEYEGSPYCLKVRNCLSVLDLDVEVRPCPQGGTVFRPEAKAKGAATFPFLEDPNTGESMCESDAIVAYLWEKYGPADVELPFLLRPGGLTNFTCYAAAIARLGPGSKAAGAKVAPEQPLELFLYDGTPFGKPVREALSELELPHVIRYCPRGSPEKRSELLSRAGGFQVPYLFDPNTGCNTPESTAIVAYLREVYG